MTTDLLPTTRRLISRSACPRELSEFAEWLSTEGRHLLLDGRDLVRWLRRM